jgi:hypothetical protein
MCLEDLRLGKGRVTQPSVTALATTSSALGADERRVAILVSCFLLSASETTVPTFIFDAAYLQFADVAGNDRQIVLQPGTTPFVLKIEELGQLITMPVSVVIVNASGAARVTLQPIISNVDAPPVFTGKP